ncbi:MAG: adaptor protein MecA [Ruminococcus sp.]|nr:adaptor protein MecA [Ruminococcus sp.]
MKTEILSSVTLKVTVPPQDFELLGIDNYDVESPVFVEFVISGIKSETGIDLSEERLCAETFDTPEGGCIMYLSAPDLDEGFISLSELACPVYETESISDLIKMSAIFRKAFGDTETSLYCNSSIIRLTARLPSSKLSAARMIFGEFGTYLGKSEALSAQTAEHFELITSGDAVKKLSELSL